MNNALTHAPPSVELLWSVSAVQGATTITDAALTRRLDTQKGAISDGATDATGTQASARGGRLFRFARAVSEVVAGFVVVIADGAFAQVKFKADIGPSLASIKHLQSEQMAAWRPTAYTRNETHITYSSRLENRLDQSNSGMDRQLRLGFYAACLALVSSLAFTARAVADNISDIPGSHILFAVSSVPL